jgi:hypothetical protein
MFLHDLAPPAYPCKYLSVCCPGTIKPEQPSLYPLLHRIDAGSDVYVHALIYIFSVVSPRVFSGRPF